MQGNTSNVMKQLLQVNFDHYKTFGVPADLDAIEKLLAEGKARDVREGYNVWSAPVRETHTKEQTEKEISRRVQEAVTAEMSKKGYSAPRKRAADEVELAPLDKPAPSEKELREAFINDLSN